MVDIHTIQISGDGRVAISYTDFPNDVRVGGQVIMERSVTIDLKHPDYEADAALMIGQAQRLLKNALEDFEESEPGFEPEPEKPADDDDEGLGMGHGDQS